MAHIIVKVSIPLLFFILASFFSYETLIVTQGNITSNIPNVTEKQLLISNTSFLSITYIMLCLYFTCVLWKRGRNIPPPLLNQGSYYT